MQSTINISSDLSSCLFTAIHHVKTVEKGSFLFQEGAEANELYLVKSGIFQLSKIIPDGRELILRMCKRGDFIGEFDLFSPSSQYLLSARVIEDGEVAVLLKEDLEEQLACNLPLAYEFIKWMSLQSRKAQTKFRDLVLHGKKGALYSTLIRLSNSFGCQTNSGIMIDLLLTNQELANFCGTSREVVNRLLSDLRKKRIITIEKGKIIILNLDLLKQEIDCENCPIEICRVD
ncbi:Crp/Fnr family transcriptional regulator [Bacillus rubiinfantis]|uniref:Crp/Fnr family transcriptional regulator n=1 Tax=Bacillus rubiinfantis TaxID=1499680 RepID=UPI000693B8C3|nr:Crp/Fnr family transcriptional regulator [Bacillus rubiinfantis]